MYDPSRDPRLFERRIDANGDEYEVMLPPPPRGKQALSQPEGPSFADSQRRNTPPPLYYSRGLEPSGPCLVGEWSADLLLNIRYLARRAADEWWETWDPEWPRDVIQFLSKFIGDQEPGVYKCEAGPCFGCVIDTRFEYWIEDQRHVHVTPEDAKQMVENARRAMPPRRAYHWVRLPDGTTVPFHCAPRELQVGMEGPSRKNWYPAAQETASPRSDRRSMSPPPLIRGVDRLDPPQRAVHLETLGEDDEELVPRGGSVRQSASPPSPNPRPEPLDPRLRNRRPRKGERDQLAKTKNGRVEKPSKGMNLNGRENVLPRLRDETDEDGDQPTTFFTANLGFRPKN